MKVKVKAIKIVQSQPTNLIISKNRKFARKRRLIFKVTTRSASSAFVESNDDDIIIQSILPRDPPLVNLNTDPENISSSDDFSDSKSTFQEFIFLVISLTFLQRLSLEILVPLVLFS